MRMSLKGMGNAAMVVALFAAPALADDDAYRQAASVPSGQAVLLARGSVAVAIPAEGRILMIDSMGNVTPIAGGGASGYAGDSGPATSAHFRSPSALAADASGNLYVADTGNHRIRRIDAVTDVVTTIVGSGDAGFDGDGGPASTASLDSPSGIAVDPFGNLYIADTGNNRIRRVDASTGLITTFAGSGDAGYDDTDVEAILGHLNAPTGLAYDAWRQRLLVADTGNHAIRSITLGDAMLHTFAGTGRGGYSGDGGSPLEARLLAPTGVAFTGAGFNYVYISDTGNHLVRCVSNETQIATVASTIMTQMPVLEATAKTPWKVKVTAPKSTRWLVGSKQVIQWSHNLGKDAVFAVELSRDGGLTWQTLRNVTTSTANGSYTWVVTQPTTGAALIRVRSIARSAYDVTGAAITIFVPES